MSDFMGTYLNEHGLEEFWTLSIEREGNAALMRASRHPKTGQIRVQGIEIAGKDLGELLMHMRAPVQEIAAENSMRAFDNAPKVVRRATAELGKRALQFWLDGYDEAFIIAWAKEQGYDVQS